MALDKFICGSCQTTFNDINSFVSHKQEGCSTLTDLTLSENSVVSTEGETITINSAGILSTADLNVQGDNSMVVADGSQIVKTELTDAVTGEQQTVIIIQSGSSSDQSNNAQCLLDDTLSNTSLLGQISSLAQLAVNKAAASPKKRKRRKKEDNESQKAQKLEKPTVPEILSDGKLQCKCCKKIFTKERFYKTHKCMPTTDYVDVSKKDAFADSDDNNVEISDAESEFDPTTEEPPDDEDFKINKPLSRRENRGKDVKETPIQFTTDMDGDTSGPEKTTLSDLPIFTSDEDKAAFEHSLNVDLSTLNIDNMFRQHMIEQDLNDKAPMASRLNTNNLSLYSCNTCDKIFKTLSHMRLHCLIHTDLRPFKCPKCTYSSNAKGNLYTHMRKHTGQFYKCKHCSFKSVNKSHLLEHEAIHNSIRHQCNICHHDYNTMKSLINHVRKYHSNTKKGEEYLASFLQGGRQTGTTVIYQCHVCNRKFKKKIDRDRHLYVHDIKDIPNVQSCELCDYTATRRVYLEKHFLKHRVIYRCVQCDEKFLSTIRLIDHLTSIHLKDDKTTKWESLFEECISNSLYLPEPDESLTGVEKQLVNLPAELSTSSVMVAESLQNMEVLSEAHSSGEQSSQNVKSDTIATASKDKANTAAAAVGGLLKNSNEEDEEDNPIEHEEEVVEENEADDKGSKMSLIDTLGYRAMSLQIFHKMRETFGHEECEYCGKLYFNKIDFENHIRTHTGDKPFPCTICGHRAPSRELLIRHKEQEHENITFPCKDCEFEASSRTQLWNHSLTHAGLGEAMGIECPECQVKFDSLKKLKQHAIDTHPDTESDALKKMHMSPVMPKAPEIKHKAHGKMGRRSYKCPYCDRVFIRANSELQKHIWIHEGIKPYKCPLCPHACRSKNNLQTHMLRHTNEKPYNCPECNKSYKSKTALRWHVRSHKAGKIFKCSKCPYEASQSCHLRRHMETHNITKRYVCQHCDYSANTLSYMKIHYTRIHKGHIYELVEVMDDAKNKQESDNQSYKCLSCDYQFGNLTDLKRHLKVRHHLQVKDLHGLEQSNSGVITAANPSVQYVQLEEDAEIVTEMPSGLQESLSQKPDGVHPVLECSSIDTVNMDTVDVDEKTASAVNILQQIFSFSNQNTVGQQFTVQSETGEVVSLNPETIIVQQEGEEVMVADGDVNLGGGNQRYVIQYLSTPDTQMEDGEMVEVVHSTVDDSGINSTDIPGMTVELDHCTPPEDLVHSTEHSEQTVVYQQSSEGGVDIASVDITHATDTSMIELQSTSEHSEIADVPAEKMLYNEVEATSVHML